MGLASARAGGTIADRRVAGKRRANLNPDRKDRTMTDVPRIREPWEGTMTARERFTAQMHHRPVDRCFNMEFGYWEENFHEWPMFFENGIANNAQAHRFFGLDRFKDAGGTFWLHPRWEPRLIAETDSKLIMQNEEGLTGEVPRDGHSTIPHFTDSAIKTPDDWRRVKAERLNPDDPARRVDVEAILREHPADRDYPLGVNTGSMIGRIRNMLTLEGLTYAVYDYPDMVEDMVETACVLVENWLEQVLGRVEFEFAAGWEDISCNTGPLVSMDFFRSVIVPRYKRISQKLRAVGIDIWYTDSDGDVRPMIPDFLEAGLNTMFPWEVNGCGHPGAVLEEYGPELRIMGGVDKMVLARSRGEIRAYLESLVPWVERGGFIPFCDHRCPPNVDPDDYLYYLDAKRDLLGM
jgi:uroporphyrinogen decarboxylase